MYYVTQDKTAEKPVEVWGLIRRCGERERSKAEGGGGGSHEERESRDNIILVLLVEVAVRERVELVLRSVEVAEL